MYDIPMLSEVDKYIRKEIEFPELKFILFFTIEYVIAIILYFGVKVLNHIKSLLPRPPRDLTGDVVMITGATSTLGASLAEEFAKKGCSIICIDKDNNLIQQLTLDLQSRYANLIDNLKGIQKTKEKSLTNPRMIAYQCDILNPNEIKELTKKFKNEVGGIDILVTCVDTPCQDLLETAMTIWKTHYSAVLAFLSLMLNRERVHIVGVTPISSNNASISSGIAISNLMECLGEKLSSCLNNCTFLAITPRTERRSIKQNKQQVARDIVEAVRRDQSNLIYGWSSHLFYRASYVMYYITTTLTEWYRD